MKFVFIRCYCARLALTLRLDVHMTTLSLGNHQSVTKSAMLSKNSSELSGIGIRRLYESDRESLLEIYSYREIFQSRVDATVTHSSAASSTVERFQSSRTRSVAQVDSILSTVLATCSNNIVT